MKENEVKHCQFYFLDIGSEKTKYLKQPLKFNSILCT